MIEPGVRLGPYEIVSAIGAGGMGEVWRAHDGRLRRDVAIKVLPQQFAGSSSALARFEREAKAVAALSHPNILAIHDFGSHDGTMYAVMELLEGATLRERLKQSDIGVPRALDWGAQIVQGLAAAHERGIVHRDLKPENIFVTRDGVVKVLDFGLALVEAEALALDQEASTAVEKTRPGTVMGTLGYLSPEQARGEAADPRSDIFAFGIVLYEMLSGRHAFQRASTAETIVAILREDPPSLSERRAVPADVDDIVRHCLEKNPDERYRSARDLAFALRMALRSSSGRKPVEPTTPPPHDSQARQQPSIAVLPFRNLSAEPEAQYFSDGMTEEIINSLSQIPALHVAARTSSFAFKGKDEDVRSIGSKLGVGTVLEGSVRQAANRLRVTAQLVDVASGYQLWSDRWDRDPSDVFAVQDEIAMAIASTLKVRLVDALPGEGAPGRTRNLEAYDRFLKGRYLWGQRRSAEAIVELQASVEMDPDFAEGYTALADAWAVWGYYGGIRTWEAWARGRAAADESARILPDSASVALSYGILEHYYGWNTLMEEKHCRTAIEKSPKSSEGWNWLSLCLMMEGRIEEGLAAGKKAVELEPHSANARTTYAWGFRYGGDPVKAERELARARELDANSGYAIWSHASALRHLGRYSEAIDVLERAVELFAGQTYYLANLGGTLAAAGERARAESILSDLQTRANAGEVNALDLALVVAGLGDADGTMAALEKARDERNALLWARIYWSDYALVHGDARWKALAARLGRAAPVTLAPGI